MQGVARHPHSLLVKLLLRVHAKKLIGPHVSIVLVASSCGSRPNGIQRTLQTYPVLRVTATTSTECPKLFYSGLRGKKRTRCGKAIQGIADNKGRQINIVRATVVKDPTAFRDIKEIRWRRRSSIQFHNRNRPCSEAFHGLRFNFTIETVK